jgi:hypothetical protein
MYLNLLILIAFLSGLYFYTVNGQIDGMTNPTGVRCPDMLIQVGTKIHLYNSKLSKVPGVNPIEFNNLEDYTDFTKWQRSKGIRCPVLFLQKSYDVQGKMTYKVRPSITNPQGGLPPTIPITNTTINNNTNIISDSNNTSAIQFKESINPSDEPTIDELADPMNGSWAGIKYTQKLVDEGYYAGNEVTRV